jgi:hypothetical protein
MSRIVSPVLSSVVSRSKTPPSFLCDVNNHTAMWSLPCRTSLAKVFAHCSCVTAPQT